MCGGRGGAYRQTDRQTDRVRERGLEWENKRKYIHRTTHRERYGGKGFVVVFLFVCLFSAKRQTAIPDPKVSV